MDQNAAERLKRLQMDDLGTARREFISTKDGPRAVLNVGLETIEASRESNQPGTKAQLMAQKNKAQLADWSNIHKTIGDTGDLENLDSLLDGQTHRLALAALLHSRPHDFAPIRGGMSRGRGGGVAGTRGRQGKPSVSKVLGQGGVSKSGNHASKIDQKQTRARKPIPNPLTKARRPMVDYSSKISAPEDFMAAVQDLVNAKTACINSTVAREMSNGNSSRPSQLPPAKEIPSQVPSRPTQPALAVDHGPSQRPPTVTRTLDQRPPEKSLPPQAQAPRTPAQKPLSATYNASTQPLLRKPSLLESEMSRDSSKRTLSSTITTNQINLQKLVPASDAMKNPRQTQSTATLKANQTPPKDTVHPVTVTMKTVPAASNLSKEHALRSNNTSAQSQVAAQTRPTLNSQLSKPSTAPLLRDEGPLPKKPATKAYGKPPCQPGNKANRVPEKQGTAMEPILVNKVVVKLPLIESTLKPNADVPVTPKKTKPLENLVAEGSEEKAPPAVACGELLDLDGPPSPEHDSAEQDPAATAVMSPSCQDLEGLVFRQGITRYPTQGGSTSSEASSTPTDFTETTRAILSQIMANAESMTDEDKQVVERKVEELRKELKFFSVSEAGRRYSIEMFERGREEFSSELKSEPESGYQHCLTCQENHKSHAHMLPETVLTAKVTFNAALGVEEPLTPLAHKSQTHRSVFQTRLKGTAPPFEPNKLNPPVSSTAEPVTTEQERQESCITKAVRHLYGNHLLPGRSGNRPGNASVLEDVKVPAFEGRFGQMTPASTPVKPNLTSPLLSQTDAISASPALQRSIHAPRISENRSPASRTPSRGLDSSRYATPALDKPLR
ncbi:hypothetical protein ASPACDRAFT_1886794 [Aspergillus aculeatus ATCC 16872]|uniref:Uncharacterized protein n=1 Tax=Aspergillus aculeatus (strain ATCC 16872 / CBS 172.66 / WB 5094) TaxID=690307 RepID=A0A1L9X2H5_ASPA1|nr:uncharacterized protein ASPACDRAFT_1886794 [Aspergillus aculeatus ATCC 16872]OJK02499.1 hypothetical protein ASPACDRAFT_1886794 [Aspergillus aculeatus ATCC 16872]